jgi:hypothetical protein
MLDLEALKYRQKPILLKVTIRLDKIQKVLSSLFSKKTDNSNNK